MQVKDVIKARRSVRTFDGRPLSEDDIKKITEYAGKADNPYGIPIEWKIMSAGDFRLTTTVITGADTFIAGKMKRVPHAEEAFGYSFEKIVLFAEEAGIGTTWIAGTFDREAFEKAIDLKDDEVMPCASPLGYPSDKMALKEKMMRKAIKADTRMDMKDLFFGGNIGGALNAEDEEKLKDVFEMIRLAPSAVNKQPWRIVKCGDAVHFYEKKSKGFVKADGWDLQKIDMGIAMCHFDLGAKECGIDAEFSIEEPDISVPEDTEYIASYIIK